MHLIIATASVAVRGAFPSNRGVNMSACFGGIDSMPISTTHFRTHSRGDEDLQNGITTRPRSY